MGMKNKIIGWGFLSLPVLALFIAMFILGGLRGLIYCIMGVITAGLIALCIIVGNMFLEK